MTGPWSIYTKGLILSAIPLLSQAVFLATLVKIRSDQAEAQKWALHAMRVLAEADDLTALFAETRSALRGYLITADPGFANQYKQYRAKAAEKLRDLRQLVADNPEQAARVAAVEARAQDLSSWFDELHGLIERGERPGAVAEAGSARGARLTAAAHDALRDFLRAEERLSADRQEALHREAIVQDWTLFGGGALALVSTAILVLAFGRAVARRLRVLTDNVRRAAAGEGLHEPLGGDDELTRLDRVFRDLLRSLEQKNQENELFVYSVSHDLRSPLVNLQGFSQELAASGKDLRRLLDECTLPDVARRRAHTLIDRNMGDSVRFIQTAVMRLSAIIDALLRLSRVGRVEYRWQQVDVQATVRRVVDALRGTLVERGAEVVVGELPPVWGDPTAVEQVFANLVGNAVNYLDPKRPGRVEVGVQPDAADGQAPAMRTFFVRDNGLGIAEAHLAKVFIAFQRLHPELARGEGVGLALVRRVVERHGGRIWLESAVGVGTTAYVTLPAHAPTTTVPTLAADVGFASEGMASSRA